MKICIVKPPILHKGISFARTATAPLGLAYIAGALKQEGHALQVIDASAQGIDEKQVFKDDIYLFGLNKEKISRLIDSQTQVICFGFMFTNNWLYDRELVKHIKKEHPQAILIAGGEHANAAAEYCLKQAPLDFIVKGEGEETIVELLNAIEKGESLASVDGIVYRQNNQIIANKPRARIASIQKIPWPAWEYFPLSSYFDNKMTMGIYRGKTLPVNATRGCPYDCTFCSSPQMWGRRYQMRPPEDFVNELEYLQQTYGVENFDLYDLTAIIQKRWIVDMCKEIIKRGLKFTYQLPSGTRSEAIDFEVAEYLFKSGCRNISYAPESGSEQVLKDIRKKVSITKMLESIKQSSKAGLNIKLNMIMGFPDDTHKDIWHSFWFLVKCSWYGANDAAPAIFSPYPGSLLFDRLTVEGKVNIYDDAYLYENIDTYDLFPPKVYSNRLSARSLRIYILLFLLIFYGSNYLFRPTRFFRTIYNILSNKHESKIEQIIYNNFLKNIFAAPNLFKAKKHKA